MLVKRYVEEAANFELKPRDFNQKIISCILYTTQSKIVCFGLIISLFRSPRTLGKSKSISDLGVHWEKLLDWLKSLLNRIERSLLHRQFPFLVQPNQEMDVQVQQAQ